jgi:hypothetical protein
VLRELRVLHVHAGHALIRGVNFGESEACGLDKQTNWCTQSCNLCSAMIKTLQGFSGVVVKNFHRWGKTNVHSYEQRGVAFVDTYAETANQVFKLGSKSPYCNCYVKLPIELGYKTPDWCDRELDRLLVTSFAGSDGYAAFIDMNTLVLGRATMPECMLIPYGFGRDGKSLIFVDLMEATWGTAFGSCPGTMLQVEREFQQQGHAFVHCAWMAFDEINRERGACEDVLKMYIANLLMPLRKNHEPDTGYGCYKMAGRSWCMNIADIPHIPSAEELSHARHSDTHSHTCTHANTRASDTYPHADAVPSPMFARPALLSRTGVSAAHTTDLSSRWMRNVSILRTLFFWPGPNTKTLQRVGWPRCRS